MKNRHVGILVLGIAAIIFFIVLSFNNALETIVDTECTHGVMCPMQTTLSVQKTLSYSLMGILLLGGLFIIFFMKDKTDAKEGPKKERIKVDMSKLDDDEKKFIELLRAHDGSMYQSDIIKESNFSKVKVTRHLDKLEGKGLIERKRRGMTNIVILK